MKIKLIGVLIGVIILVAVVYNAVQNEEIEETITRQAVTEINGEKINSTSNYISFAVYNTSFIANNDLLDTNVAPVFHYFNAEVYLPMDLVLTELGYEVIYNANKINITNSKTNESYTLNKNNKSLKNNNEKDREKSTLDTVVLNDVRYIDLKSLEKNFPIYSMNIDGVYAVSNQSNQFTLEKAINQYKITSVPEYIAFESEEDFNNYLEVTNVRDNWNDENILAELFDYYIGPYFVNYEETAMESSGSDYSETITQYSNVDEGDIVKTDGEYIYYARISSYLSDTVEIISTNENGEISNASTIELNLDDAWISDLYIEEDNLIIIGNYNVNSSNNPIERRYDMKNKVVKNMSFIKQYDIRDKANPKFLRENYFTGNNFDSRLVDGRVYVYTRAYMFSDYSYNKIPMYKNSLEGEFKNIPYENIYYNSNLDSDRSLNIFSFDIEEKDEELIGYSFIIDNYVDVNITTENIYLCGVKDIYNTPTPLYLNTKNLNKLEKELNKIYNNHFNYSSYSESKISKLTFNDGVVTYVDTGYIKGHINDQYSIDEYQSFVRVATSNVEEVIWYDEDENPTQDMDVFSTNKVYVLDEQLNIIGESEGFGKEESIKSVRFMGDKAYVVTFRTMDPLFVFDLEDPTKPTILGELKIPGFSTFMLPFEEDYLIGVGVDTEETENGGFIQKGMKLSLFDISDYLNPTEKHSVTLNDYHSYALENPKAIMFNENRKLIGLPIFNSNYLYENDGGFNGATIYNVDSQQGFIHLGDVEHKRQEEDFKSLDTGSVEYTYMTAAEEAYIDERTVVKRIVQIYNNIYTVSDVKMQSNKLDTFEMTAELFFEKSSY